MTDLTGIWESEIIDFAASQKHTSESRINQTGAYIWANSASTWGMLAGYVQVTDGEEWLNALFSMRVFAISFEHRYDPMARS
jgi:hypothetical protein